MKATAVTVNSRIYAIRPLNFDEYEEFFSAPEGATNSNAKLKTVVKAGLDSGGAGEVVNPEWTEIPAGDVLKLFGEVLALSGLKSGEAQATEGQST